MEKGAIEPLQVGAYAQSPEVLSNNIEQGEKSGERYTVGTAVGRGGVWEPHALEPRWEGCR